MNPLNGEFESSERHSVSATEIIPEPLPANMGDNRLANIRPLQIGALLIAFAWCLISFLASRMFIDASIKDEIGRLQTKVDSEARFISQIIARELNTAEQLAVALSHESDVILLVDKMNTDREKLNAMSFTERYYTLTNEPQVLKVNDLLTGIAHDLGLMSVFVLDANGNCIVSSYFSLNGQDDLGCLGSNYASRDYFQRAREFGEGMQFAVGKRIPQPSMFFAKASVVGQTFAGVVVARLDALHLMENLRDLPTTSWLTDSAGMTITSNRQPLLLNFMETLDLLPPEPWMLRNVYALSTLTHLPLRRSRTHPPEWSLWLLNDTPVVMATATVENWLFQLWHTYPASAVLETRTRSWYFAATIIFLGLLVILFAERMVDFHQRRVANLAALSQLNRSLEDATQKLFSIATTDHLTQLASRGYFFHRLKQEINKAKLTQTPLALLEVDIDYFKRINDTYGHPAGDTVIQCMADLCRESVRSSDLIGRIGGEEFAITLPNCSKTMAIEIAEKLRQASESSPVEYEGQTICFTCSIGVTLLKTRNLQSLLSVVDKALYEAKNTGRNRVQFLD